MSDLAQCVINFISCYYCTGICLECCSSMFSDSFDEQPQRKNTWERKMEAKYGSRAMPAVALQMDRTSLKY